MQRLSARSVAPKALAVAAQARAMHFPCSKPPIEITYVDTDPLEYALRTEARVWGFDDMQYMRELAFIRINDNPTVGTFRTMTPDQRRDLFWGSDRQDFYLWFTWKVMGKPEHLYHKGYDY